MPSTSCYTTFSVSFVYLFIFIYFLSYTVGVRKTEVHNKQLLKHYYKITQNKFLSLSIFKI